MNRDAASTPSVQSARSGRAEWVKLLRADGENVTFPTLPVLLAMCVLSSYCIFLLNDAL